MKSVSKKHKSTEKALCPVSKPKEACLLGDAQQISLANPGVIEETSLRLSLVQASSGTCCSQETSTRWCSHFGRCS
jgi:hypothetical protein